MQQLGIGHASLLKIAAMLGLSIQIGHDQMWRKFMAFFGSIQSCIAQEVVASNVTKEVTRKTELHGESTVEINGSAGITVSFDAGWQKRSSGHL